MYGASRLAFNAYLIRGFLGSPESSTQTASHEAEFIETSCCHDCGYEHILVRNTMLDRSHSQPVSLQVDSKYMPVMDMRERVK